MANLTESATYDAGVYQIETSDAVIGGPTGISNKGAKNLANRTAYLKAHMDNAETALASHAISLGTYGSRISILEASRVHTLGSNYSRGMVAYNSGSPMAISASDVGKVILIQPPTLTNTVRLPSLSGIENGAVFTFVIQVTNATYYKSATGFTSLDGTIAAVDLTGFTDGDTVQFVRKDASNWQCIVINKKNMALPGTLKYFGSSTPPVGYIAADGAAISRSTYARLFAEIGVTHGAGDGVTTFNVPDGRGVFIRGWDNGRGIDPSRVFGSQQMDAFKSHTHNVSVAGDASLDPGATTYRTARSNSDITGLNDPIGLIATGDTETRPINIALLACIKY